MQLQKLYLAALFCLLFAACKKDGDDNNTEDTADKLAAILTVQNEAAELYADTLAATQDSMRALNAVGQWLLDQPEVDKAYYWNSQLIEVKYKSGLKSYLSFIWQDANGQHRTRGSGAGALTQFGAINSETEDIKNEKVLILNPFILEFNEGVYNKASLFSGGPKPLDITISNGESVRYDVLSTLGDYGFIILNTHGIPDGFALFRHLKIDLGAVETYTEEMIIDSLNAHGVPIEKFTSGELVFDFQVALDGYELKDKTAMYVVTDKYIRNSSLDLSDAVVFGNHCYSGYTALGPNVSNMSEAWRSKGAATYYGYAFASGNSQVVDNKFALRMEDSLISNLAKNGDTTGIANLANNSTIQFNLVHESSYVPLLVERGLSFSDDPGVPDPLRFLHFFETNYSYGNCGDTLTDIRDGQKYATVCIGEQVWMAQNLRYNAPGSVIAHNLPSELPTYGRYYDYQTVSAGGGLSPGNQPSTLQGICPEGWHLPNFYEWEQLKAAIGLTNDNELAVRLKSPDGWDSDSDINHPYRNATDFNALPSDLAQRDFSSGVVEFLPSYSEFFMWLSSPHSGCSISGWTGYVYLRGESGPVQEGCISPTGSSQIEMYSCRCVKD